MRTRLLATDGLNAFIPPPQVRWPVRLCRPYQLWWSCSYKNLNFTRTASSDRKRLLFWSYQQVIQSTIQCFYFCKCLLFKHRFRQVNINVVFTIKNNPGYHWILLLDVRVTSEVTQFRHAPTTKKADQSLKNEFYYVYTAYRYKYTYFCLIHKIL